MNVYKDISALYRNCRHQQQSNTIICSAQQNCGRCTASQLCYPSTGGVYISSSKFNQSVYGWNSSGLSCQCGQRLRLQ